MCGLSKDPQTQFAQILVMVDKFTKYVLLEPCPLEIDAKQTAAIFLRRVVSEHGVPAVVISDRGPQFASELWSAVLKSLGSRVALAATHHPQTDGQSERVIQTLTRIIRAYVRDQSPKWVEMLPLFQFALNNSSSAATHLTPFQLLHGRDPAAPPNFLLYKSQDEETGLQLGGKRRVVAWAREWWKARRKLCEFAAKNLKSGAKMMKRRYDIGRRKFKGEPGDLVLLSVKSHPDLGEAKKLRLKYTGPYVIKAKVHENAFELEGLPPTVPTTQNVEYLRLFFPSPDKFSTRPHPAKAAGPVRVDDHNEWEVEAITGDRIVNGERRYCIKWRDHEKQDLLRLTQLKHCAELLREYQQSKGIALDFWTESSSSPESQTDNGESDQSSGDEVQLSAPTTQQDDDDHPDESQNPDGNRDEADQPTGSEERRKEDSSITGDNNNQATFDWNDGD